ncbi:Maleylacetate reductase 2 [Achromobacter veterisilvae]|uniref:Maleylacetate reductase 2 n=1 Tax=Achromobacter veterisilvae TaxID=2069367 RepID=A0A446CJ14_9BURK|nr:iron-containing alcohol dehydrogenase [Achromobacter veterisilvae]SSW67870.1 Maleylacetate reductase 2 [Achromobacter veterisilvae]
MAEFSSISPGVRIHAGAAALDLLPREAARLGARRAFVVCGNSVATRTPLLARIRELLGDSYAGAYTRLGKDAPLEDVQEAVRQAAACRADLLIAVGAGSVLKGTRVIAMALGEGGELARLATQYPEHGAPVSPRLRQPKPPIFNVLTAATSAQNRAGAALRRGNGGPRLEFFDPKTRPAAIFWDAEALASAPPSLALSTGLGVYWRALMNIGAVRQANPLVQASRLHAYTLSRSALPRMRDPGDVQARLDMCAAALLQNRDEDDGGRPFDAHWVARSVYALGAALFNGVPHLDQGATHVLLTASAIRHFADLCPDAVAQMGKALDLPAAQAARPECVAEAVRSLIQGLGLPDRLEGVSKQDREQALASSLFNFNADRTRELSLYRDRLQAILLEST